MKWHIHTAKSAAEFMTDDDGDIKKSDVLELVKKAIQRFSGKDTNVDVKKLRGDWNGYYRIRKGNIRIIISFNFDTNTAIIAKIDNRGSVYE